MTNVPTDTAPDRPDEEAEAVLHGEPADAPVNGSTHGTGYPDADGYVDIGVTKVDMTIETRPNGEERPLIHIFGRTDADTADDGDNLEHVVVRGYRPYFYAPSNEVPGDLPETESVVRDTADGYRGIRGTTLTRIVTQTPGDVPAIRDQYDHYEADILFPNRFRLDKGITSGVRVPERRKDDGTIVVPEEEVEAIDLVPDLPVMMIDIEVDDRNGFPENGEEPVICLTTHDSITDQYLIWYYEAPENQSDDADTPRREEISADEYDPIPEDVESVDVSIVTFQSEERMLAEFMSYVESVDPCCLTGWNFIDFDAEYLIERLEHLRRESDMVFNDGEMSAWDALDPGRMSRLGEANTNWDAEIKGRIVLDLLEAYKRTKFSDMESYRLDYIGEAELGVGKETYLGDLGDLWVEDPRQMLLYNLRDVELCVELDRQQTIIPFWQTVASFCGCSLSDAPIPGDAVDMYVLHKTADDPGEKPMFVLPSAEYSDSEEYEGGAVFDAYEGVAKMVTTLDLKSLYPMCMWTINASPETKVDPEEYDGETYRAPNDIYFRKEPDGIIREIIDELLSERERKKEQRDEYEPGTDEYEKFDRQQGAIKVVMNSLYGTLGWEKFRLYDKDMGAAVTATGREVIKHTEKAVNELGHDVTYGDTDSVLIELGDIEKETAIEQSFHLEEQINAAYDDFAAEELNADDHRFQIEFEKLYKRFFQAGKKKRYAGHIIWKEGKDVDATDITGFETERSDTPTHTKEVQTKVLEMIVRGHDLEEIQSYLEGVTDNYLNGEVPLDNIAKPSGIGKELDNYESPTAHVRGAIYANLFLGTNFGKGSSPKRVYLDSVDPSFFDGGVELNNESIDDYKTEFRREPDVICFEYPEQVPETFNIGYEEMMERFLQGPIERVLDPFDITWDEVVASQTQTGLGDYM